MSSTAYKKIHYEKDVPDLSGPFQIICPPSTDVWEKPPSTHSFNAPIIYQELPKSSFKSVKVNVTGEWKQKYDQGGLALILNFKDGSRKWVKTGIEFLNNEPHVSVVATDRWSDWSLRPLLTADSTSATIEIESNEDGSLWVWLLSENGSKSPLREVTWWSDLPEDTVCWVGAYAAKPDKDPKELVVKFQDFSITLV